MIRRPPRSTLSSSSAASDVYKRQLLDCSCPLRWTRMVVLSVRYRRRPSLSGRATNNYCRTPILGRSPDPLGSHDTVLQQRAEVRRNRFLWRRGGPRSISDWRTGDSLLARRWTGTYLARVVLLSII